VPVAVVRPGAIYGPGETRLLKLFRAIARGRYAIVGSGRSFYHPVYIDDLVAGFLLALERPEAVGQSFIVAGPRYVSQTELADVIARETGGRVLPHPYATAASLTTPQVDEGITFLTKYLTGDHVMVPGDLSGPNANGNNLEQMFAQGQVAMWEEGDWNTVSVKSSVTFPVGVATLPIGPDGRVSVFNGLIDGLNSHTRYPKQAWELEQWLGSPQSEAILGSGGYVWPAIKSLDPLFLKYWQKQGIDMQAFLTEAHGQVVNFPNTPGVGDALTDIVNDLGPAFLGTEPVSQALQTAQTDANYVLRTS